MRNYRYAVERAMRALGGWIALTPAPSAKLLRGRHVWGLARQADAFGRRLPELRAHTKVSGPASERVVAFMDAVGEPAAPGQPVGRLFGVYRALKPHLLSSYHDHLVRANPVYEPPTRRLLLRCIDDERRHIAAGETVLGHLCAPALAERVLAWQRRLEALVEAAGGVTGEGLPPAPPDTAQTPIETSDDAREFVRLERPVASWPMPEDLREALDSFGESLRARNLAAVAHWLPARGSPDPPRAALTGATLTRPRLRPSARPGPLGAGGRAPRRYGSSRIRFPVQELAIRRSVSARGPDLRRPVTRRDPPDGRRDRGAAAHGRRRSAGGAGEP